MRELPVSELTAAVRRLCIEANYQLPPDVTARLQHCRDAEPWPPARDILDELLQNAAVAAEGEYPLCQDTGLACVFLKLGQDVHLTGGDLATAVDEGVRQACRDGGLRASAVRDPLQRQNTGDNTPALLTVELVPGDKCEVTVAPKGFGSENMSALKMLRPSDGKEGLLAFVLDTVRAAGPNPCPPIVVGVGVGGSFDKAALLAKKALLRPLGSAHPDPLWAEIETTLLQRINALGIGPQGFGGKTSALSVAVETMPTHITALPVAVNISCHVTRHAAAIL